jgi:hypothetical protein
MLQFRIPKAGRPCWLSCSYWLGACRGTPCLSKKSRAFPTVHAHVNRHFELIDDPVIRRVCRSQVGRRILATLPPQPFNYEFHVIREETYNAFAIPAGYIFINSGLLLAMDSEDELAGILSHEIAHVVCRHIAQRIERSKKSIWLPWPVWWPEFFSAQPAAAPKPPRPWRSGRLAAGQTLAAGLQPRRRIPGRPAGPGYLDKAGLLAGVCWKF